MVVVVGVVFAEELDDAGVVPFAGTGAAVVLVVVGGATVVVIGGS